MSNPMNDPAQRLNESAQPIDRATTDARTGLAAMPLSVGRYLRSLSAAECQELGQWLLRRSGLLQGERLPPATPGVTRLKTLARSR